MKKITFVRMLCYCFAVVALSSCTDQQRKSFSSMPLAIGTPCQTLIIIDPTLANSVVSDSISYNLEAAFPLLPAPEPMLDLTPMAFDDMTEIKFQWKNIIFVADLSEKSALTDFVMASIGTENAEKAAKNPATNFALQKNRWAKNQQILFIYGYGKQNVANAISQRAEMMIEKIYAADRSMITGTVYSMGISEGINSTLRTELLIDMKIPKEYRSVNLRSKDMWLRKTTKKADLGILIHKFPYSDSIRVDRAGILQVRNAIGKRYITSTLDGSYMTTDVKSLSPPVYFKETSINGNYAIEARGIWAMSKGFMGGAFISYLVYHEPSKSVVFLDGFAHAPDQDKRKYIQELDVILNSLSFL
jgi:hypothetical protein